MVRKNFYIRHDQLKFLQNLPGNDSEHIREAIDDYMEKKKHFNVSESLSEGGKTNG